MARRTINGLAVSTEYRLRPPKFMTLFLFMFEWSRKNHFSNLFLKFWKMENFVFDDFDIKESPFWKKIHKYPRTIFFFKKSYFFFLNLYCTCSKLFFDVYNSHVSKIFNFDVFLHENFHFSPWSFDSRIGQKYSS